MSEKASGWTPEKRAEASRRSKERMGSIEARAAVSEATRALMSAPEVREKISERTRAAMRRPETAAKIAQRSDEAQLRALRNAWARASARVQREFLVEIHARLTAGHAGAPEEARDGRR